MSIDVCDNLKEGVVKALWFELTLNATAMAEHYDTTIRRRAAESPGRRRRSISTTTSEVDKTFYSVPH